MTSQVAHPATPDATANPVTPVVNPTVTATQPTTPAATPTAPVTVPAATVPTEPTTPVATPVTPVAVPTPQPTTPVATTPSVATPAATTQATIDQLKRQLADIISQLVAAEISYALSLSTQSTTAVESVAKGGTVRPQDRILTNGTRIRQ